MNKTEGTMEKLKMFVTEGLKHLERDGNSGLIYVSDIVVRELQNVFRKIEGERHKVDEPEDGKDNFVIHYTSIRTLVSMLENEMKNKQNAAKDKQESSNEQNDSLRLYDSVHFNDPDEGDYFFRHLNLPKKYNWLGGKKESHAYIASFIINPQKTDMSDNLVFWRTYGKEGEGCSLKLRIPSCKLREVLYGANEVKCTEKTLRLVLDAIYPLVSIDKPSLREKVREKLAEAVWKSLATLRYLYKSEAYKYEAECRFVIPELDANKNKIYFEYTQQSNDPKRIRHYSKYTTVS